MSIIQLLEYQVQHQASDLHLSVGEQVMLRINGQIMRLKSPELKNDILQHLAYSMLAEAQIKQFEQQHQLDFAYEVKGLARFRINLFQQRRGLAMAIRQIPFAILSLKQLRVPCIIHDLAVKPRGLVLLTGPTGCGKSTTLAAMVDYYNTIRKGHIITIEDPIEFIHQSKNCLITQREIGTHSQSFANALKAALREDPDVILIGEMRDLETINLALEAAETGHLVLATLHTSGAAKSIDRIINVFPAQHQALIRTMLAESLQGVISQTLCRKKDGTGRVATFEILQNTPAIANLIRENKIAQIRNIMQLNRAKGMSLLDDNLQELVAQNIISIDEAQLKADNPEKFNPPS